MASLPPGLVYEGFWVDHSRGSIFGSTLTLRSECANTVIVILTLLIAFAGPHLWDLLAFFYFLRHTTDAKRDGIHHQLQHLLRNSSMPANYVSECGKMAWYWRRHLKRQWFRLAFSALVALLCSVGFIIAGIFSSAVSSTSFLPVLVKPPVCGHWPNFHDIPLSDEASMMYERSLFESLKLSRDYSQSCWNSSVSNGLTCHIYAHSPINYTWNYNDCPFSNECILETDSSIAMDTGLLNSDTVFGINAKKEDQIYIRKKSTCGPMNADPYLQKVDDQVLEMAGRAVLPGNQGWGWALGPPSKSMPNYTYLTTTFNANLTENFKLSVRGYYPQANLSAPLSNTWVPPPQFIKNDSDTTLILLEGNAVLFMQPVDDVLFSAHRAKDRMTIIGDNMTMYQSDSLGRMVGCTEQYQFCTSTDHCTDLVGNNGALAQADNLEMNDQQRATLQLFKYQFELPATDMYILGELSEAPLQATTALGPTGFMGPLPPDQWQHEVRGWFSLVLAQMQKSVADLATGPLGSPADSQYYQYLEPPSSAAETELCHQQKMIAPSGFSNLNVFGLSFIVGVCGLIVLANMITTPLMKLLARHYKPMSVGMRHWIGEGMLQVQRKAFEAAGRDAAWRNLEHDVPYTQDFDQFEGIAVEDSVDGLQKWYKSMAGISRASTAVHSDGGVDSLKWLTKRTGTLESISSESSDDSSKEFIPSPLSKRVGTSDSMDSETTEVASPTPLVKKSSTFDSIGSDSTVAPSFTSRKDSV